MAQNIRWSKKVELLSKPRPGEKDCQHPIVQGADEPAQHNREIEGARQLCRFSTWVTARRIAIWLSPDGLDELEFQAFEFLGHRGWSREIFRVSTLSRAEKPLDIRTWRKGRRNAIRN